MASNSTESSLIPRSSLSDTVYERLRDGILRNEFEDGTVLNQVHLAERYGVSRIPIREALRRLQSESLVVATPYHPFVVRRLSGDQILDLMDARVVLEDLGLTKQGLPSPECIEELRNINRRLERTVGDDFVALDRRLHQLITGPDSLITEMISDVRDRIHSHLARISNTRPGRETATVEHAGLIDALADQDLERARVLLRDHVMSSRASIVARLSAETAVAE